MSDHNSLIPPAFTRTVADIVSQHEWKALLLSGRQLRIKYGVDVTAPDLHIGHAVNLWMMRMLQDMGHKVIFLIGDFTTTIGDPSGKNKTRPVISQEAIEKNAEEFIRQARMVLRFDDPHLIEVRRNSEWFGKMPAAELLSLLAMVTHARLISRDMFQRRIASGDDIRMHELVYPLLQGFDSWKLESDLTIVGSDQLFNEMMGRFFQEKLGQTPQVIITSKVTPGLDGGPKQSKSLGNYIGLAFSPTDKFGKAMTLKDELIGTFFEAYTDVPDEVLLAMRILAEENPFEAKKRLAHAIVRRFHGSGVADEERARFEATFSRRETPTEMPEVTLESPTLSLLDLLQLHFGGAKSRTQIRTLITQGGVRRSGTKVTNPTEQLRLFDGEVFQVGQRSWFRVHFNV